MMARYLGPVVMRLFADPDVTEVYVNPDGRVRIDSRTAGRVEQDTTLSRDHVEAFLNAVATSIGLTLGPDRPRLEAELPHAPFDGARLQGFVPPVVAAPAFVIRRPAGVVVPLAAFVAGGVLPAASAEVLAAAVLARETVLVAGPTGSGKTTLANALLQIITRGCPADRLVILEDTRELRSEARDVLALRTGPGVTLADLVKSTLRSAPDRIVVGEVRGAEALDLLDAWATGHPGGVGTVHAASAVGALERLDRLAQRAGVPPQRALIAEAVDLVAVLHSAPDATGTRRRRLVELARVAGVGPDGAFRLTPLPLGDPT
jgi:type IV secretion system protein VirB11